MATQAAAQKMQLILDECHLFSSSDDAGVMKKILATHAPDGHDVHVRPLLHIVEDVLQRSTPTILTSPTNNLEVAEDKMHHVPASGMLEALVYTIHKISSEIIHRCSGCGEAHQMTVQVFNVLANYSWDAKAVLALAAFAVGYSEFWLTIQLHTVNPLAKSVAHLKQLPDILEHTDALKPRFDAINNLIRAMLDVTKTIVEFEELPSEYISPDSSDISMALAHIPTAVYWLVRGIVACSSQIIGLIGLGHEYITATTEAWELSSLAHKLTNIQSPH